jgi:hypothetical protein
VHLRLDLEVIFHLRLINFVNLKRSKFRFIKSRLSSEQVASNTNSRQHFKQTLLVISSLANCQKQPITHISQSRLNHAPVINILVHTRNINLHPLRPLICCPHQTW